MTSTQWGGLVALIAIAVATLALIALHLLPTGLSPLRDPVSRYGITRFKSGYATAAFGAGIAGIGSLIAVAALPGSLPTVVLLAVFAAARILIPFFPMDAPEASKTTTGRVHDLLAVLAFGGVIAAMFVAAGMLHDAGLTAAGLVATIGGVVGVVGTLLMLVSRRSPRLAWGFGFGERLIYLAFIVWIAVLGTSALTS
ncbi:DUF998 domain-containing protein [Herbiconiux sp. A18JL235]|uniref:DUF998 domain-containing protein n=1 Tax=Herbiconiux sp. A18JL235 TaxID=3152363 RepID=A0AB39BKM4_9MICO